MKYYIIDFDSTFVKVEALDELAKIILKNHPDKQRLVAEIERITKLGMEGKIGFTESLARRVKLLKIKKEHIGQLVKMLKRNVSDSVKRNKRFFRKYKNQIYIISGGFREFVLPVVKPFGIMAEHVLTNRFLFNGQKVTGYDKTNPLSRTGGKIATVKNLRLDGEIYVIGDGYSDYQLKEMGLAKKFLAFSENVRRDSIMEKADNVIPNFDEFLYINKLPMAISYPKSRIRVLLLEHIDDTAVSLFEKEGYTVDYVDKPLTDAQFFAKIEQAWILGIRSRTCVDTELLHHARHLMVVGAYCIGTNQIDLSGCTQKGITAFNAPYSNTRSVVELTIGEIIMLQRGIIVKNSNLHQGIWDKSAKNSHEIRGKKLGIIGYGNIGSQLSVLAEALGMEVYFFDTADKLALGNAKKCASLKDLLKISDVITVHVDGNKNNTHLIAENEFALMKPGAIFLNASRGFVVDLKALAANIKNGKIRGAAVDVFPDEPKDKSVPFRSELRQLQNVILTPHIAGSTEEAQKDIAVYVTNKIIEYINTGQTMMSVNFPAIQLPIQKNAHRLLHLHKNTPGILARINGILANNRINILGQYLKTNDHVGYVITDVNKQYNRKVLAELKAIPDTIRFRILY